ncbi:glycosyltransferase family 25 protein [Streptosporangium sp. NPDC004631]
MITSDDLRVYVVNLRRRADRRHQMQELLPEDFKANYTSDWNGPFDGAHLDRAELTRHGYELFPWEMESDHRWWGRPLRFGEIGCTISHLHCWRDALGTTASLFLVLEDDVSLSDDFQTRLLRGLNSLDDLEEPMLIYLGRDPQEPDAPRENGFLAPGFSYGSYGYLVNRTAVQAFLASDLHRGIIPMDEFLPAMYLDHPRTDVRRRYSKRIRALAFEPPLVTQLPKREAGSDTELSAFVSDV